jgi:RND family efflux transporter MFP subunit
MKRERFSAFALLASLVLAGCPASDGGGPAPARPVEVEALAPARRDVAREIALPVELWAWQRVSIVAKVTGYVAQVPVDRGSVAKEGDLLGTIYAPELEDALRKGSAEVKVAEADVTSARATLELESVTARRFASLLADRAVSVQEADEARARELVAQAAVAQAEARLASAREALATTQTWLGYTKVTAPFHGTVNDRWVHPGAFVSAAERTPLFELADASTIRAVIDVPEGDVPSVHTGETRVRVSLPALRGRPCEGVVSRSAAALDAKTRTLRIEVDLENDRGELDPGMFGQASLVLEVHKDALVVPATAIVRGSGEPSVFVVVDAGDGTGHKAVRRSVRLGLEDGKVAEVLTGLEPTDQVVARGLGLVDGAPVHVASAPPAEKR